MATTAREDDVQQVMAKVLDLLIGALTGTGSGSFAVQYEAYRAGIYRVVLRGTIAWRFYVTREQVARRRVAIRGKRVSNSLDGLMAYIESTMLDALSTTGFGEFLVEYDGDGAGTSRVTIKGTERNSFSITTEEIRTR